MKKLRFIIISGLFAAGLVLAAGGCQLITVPTGIAYTLTHGVALGGSAQPYYVYSKADLKELNTRMKDAGVPVTLADTYLAAYRQPFNMLPPKGSTGQLAGDMQSTNMYFHRILAAKKIPDAGNYLLTSIGTAQVEGWGLFALVYRPESTIFVKKKLDPSVEMTVRPREDEYYRPYRTNTLGMPLDTVLDWVALPNDCYETQAQQALLLTLSAIKVIERKPAPGYWTAEQKWLAGDFMSVVKEQDKRICSAMGTEEGFTIRRPAKKVD